MAENFSDFINCGEILLAPSSLQTLQYILKCGECEEYYSDLGVLLLHCVSHIESDSNVLKKSESLEEFRDSDHDTLDAADNEEEVVKTKDFLGFSDDEPNSEDTSCKRAAIKQENTASIDNDPLTSFKQEAELDISMDEDMECVDKMESAKTTLESEKQPLTINSTFVVEFLKSDKKVTTFISAYKNQPFLWKGHNFSLNMSRERFKCLQNIAREVQEKIDLKLTTNQVIVLINRLRRDYKQRSDRIKRLENIGVVPQRTNETLTYLDKLHFLKPLVKTNSISYLDAAQCNLTTQQIIQILGIYERFPHLWNTNLIENVCENKRLNAFEQIQEVLQSEMALKVSQQSVERYIYNLNNHFSREKRRDIKNLTSTKGRSEFYQHMLFLMDHVGPVKCDQCNRQYENPLTVKVHKHKHDGLLHLKCSLCNKEYRTFEPYKAHAKRHMNDLNVECKECGRKFLRHSCLRLHMRTHTGEKPYCCEICGTNFRYINELKSHRKRHDKVYSHCCPYCSKGFHTKDEMNNHITTHTNTRNFPCSICGKAFKTAKNLRNHKMVHEEGLNHLCPLCGKAFKNKLGIYHHMKTHRRQEVPELD